MNRARLDFTAASGFDIPGGVAVTASGAGATGRAFAALTVGGTTQVYGIELGTGAATPYGSVPTLPLVGLAVEPAGAGRPAVALSADGRGLVRFDTAAPGRASAVRVTGVLDGETLVGVDYRPSTGQLYALGIDGAADIGRLYRVDPQTGVAAGFVVLALVDSDGQPTDLPDAAAGYGFDFDPAADLATVTATAPGASLLRFRIDPADGAAVDGKPNEPGTQPDPSTAFGADGTAFSAAGGYFLGAEDNTLTRPTVDNSPPGTAADIGPDTQPVTLNGAVLDFSAANGFDIRPDTPGQGTALLTVGGVTGLYTIDLATRAATLVGTAAPLLAGATGLAVGTGPATLPQPPGGEIEFASPSVTFTEGGTALVTLGRFGDLSREVAVTVRAAGGTATAGVDYLGLPVAVRFLPGQAQAEAAFRVEPDALTEGFESIELVLEGPTNGAVLGARATATARIADPAPAVDPGLRFASPAVTADEGAGTVSVVITRSAGLESALTVSVVPDFSLTFAPPGRAALTAGADADVTGFPVQATFAPGQTTATVTLTVVDDGRDEPAERLVLGLADATVPVTRLGTSTTTLTVTDNDTTAALVGGPAGGAGRVFSRGPSGFGVGSAIQFGFTGPARVATADVTGDGVPDYIAGAGPGEGSRVVIIDGRPGTLVPTAGPNGTRTLVEARVTVSRFDAFEAAFTGGVFVAAADFDGDGRAEVVVTPDQGGGPVVAVYSGAVLAQGVTEADPRGERAEIGRFFGIEDPAFRGGARAALGDLSGDGTPDLVVSAGFLGGPRVALFDGTTLRSATPRKLLPDFFAFEEGLRNGSFVAAGDVTGDGVADLAVGGGPGGGPRVRLFDAKALLAAAPFPRLDAVPSAQRANFFAGDPDARGGVRLAIRDVTGTDGAAELLTGSGEGEQSRVRVYGLAALLASATPTADAESDPFGVALPGGVFVG